MDINLKTEIIKYQADLIIWQGNLLQAQQRTQQLSNGVVLRQGIIAYLQQLNGQEEGRKLLQDIISRPEPPVEPPPAPAPDEPPEAST